MDILKKLGAGALSMAMLGGGSILASADPAPITANGGNSEQIRGYQVGNPTGYAATVTWGDMTFIYDNGTFDPDDGIVKPTTSLTNPEAGYQSGQIGKWYGFDGSKNHVTVTNLSTDDIHFTATAAHNAENTGVTPSLYYAVDEAASGEYEGVSHEAPTDKMWTLLGNTAIDLDEKDGMKDSETIYLNLSGAPKADLSNDSANAEEVGTVTLTITQGAYTPGP